MTYFKHFLKFLPIWGICLFSPDPGSAQTPIYEYNVSIPLFSSGKQNSGGYISWSGSSGDGVLGPNSNAIWRSLSEDGFQKPDFVEDFEILSIKFPGYYSDVKINLYASDSTISTSEVKYDSLVWNRVPKMTLIGSIQVHSWDSVSVSNEAKTTIQNWLIANKKVYIGGKLDDESGSDFGYIPQLNLKIKYKKRFKVSAYYSPYFEGTSALSLGGTTMVGNPGEKKYFENESVVVNALANFSKDGATFKFVRMSVGNNQIYTTSHTFQITGNTSLTAYYTRVVNATLANKATYGTVTEENISNSTLEVRESGTLIKTFSSGQTSDLPYNQNLNVRTVYGTDGKKLDHAGTYKLQNQNWAKDLATTNLDTTVSNGSNFSLYSYFHELFPVQIGITMEGISQSVSGLSVYDPWKAVNGSRPKTWDPYSVPFTPGTGDFSSYGGLFRGVDYQQSNPLKKHYKVKVDATQKTISGSSSYFLGWKGTGTTIYSASNLETPVRFDAANAVVSANYKGNLRTGSPELGDPVNQRRLVTDNYYQLMIYESMGEIWATWKGESSNWRQEVRLSTGNGNAKNPSLSNVFVDYYTLRAVATWIEGNQIIVQPLEWGNSFQSLETTWDHSAGAPLRDYTTLSLAGLPRTDSRPVMNLERLSNGNFSIWYAFEENNSGITTGLIELTNNVGYYSFSTAQFKSFGFLGSSTEVSVHVADQYPVLINQPAALGYPAKKAIYFLAGGYASGRRIAEYLPGTAVTTILPISSNEYTFTALGGGLNSTSASYALVATAQINGSNGTTYNTEIFLKPTYTTGVPTLSKVYTNSSKPGIMVQNTSNFGTPVYEVNFAQGTNWYKATGSATLTLVGSNASGVFTKEQVGASDRKTIYVKTSTSPATLTLYSGSGLLNKGESVLYADVRSVRNYTTLTGVSKTAILDFAGALVEPVDSLESGSVLCAVKLISPDQNSIIVRQPDSIKTALAVDVVRAGVAIRSYSAGVWETLSVNSFEEVQDGDVLVFRLGYPVAASSGYEIYDFNGTNLTKPEETTKPATELKVLENGVAVYPNPFNPSTSIAVSLASPAAVRVTVFNILGQQVVDFGKSDLGAGVHTFPFDGRLLASGTYFYRVEIGDKVKTGKLQLLK